MIQHLGHQPLQFFTEEDACACPEMPFCFKVTAEDVTAVQLHLSRFDTDELMANGNFSLYVSGSADAGSGATTLVDANASFQNFGIQAGWMVKNTTSGIEGTVTSVDSQTQLTTSNAFAAADGYQIYAWSGTNILVRWDFDGSTLTRTASAGSDTIEGATLDLCDTAIYRVTVIVTSVQGASGALFITVGGGTTQTMAIPVAGTYTLIFQPQTVTTGLTIATNAAASGMVITSVALGRVSSPMVNIEDCETEEVILEADVEYLPDNTVLMIDNTEPTPVMVNVVWSELENGCYRICVVDETELCIEYICNGGFDTISGTATSNVLNNLVDSSERWTIYDLKIGTSVVNTTDNIFGNIVTVSSQTALLLDSDAFPDGNESWELANCWTLFNEGWALNNNASFIGTGDAIIGYIYQDLEIPLVAARCYVLEFEITAYVAGTLVVSYNSDSTAAVTTDIQLGTYTTAGVHRIKIEGLVVERITFASSIGEAQEYTIDNVTLGLGEFGEFAWSCDEDFGECAVFSECICLETHPCTKAITATNDDDIDVGNGAYLDFTNFTWSMLMRAEIKFWHPKKQDPNYLLYVSDSGAGIKVHSDRTRVTRTIFERMPADRIMALWDMLGMDTFAIATQEYYTQTSDNDPEYDDFSNDSEVEIELVKQYDKFENVNA